MLSNLHAQAAGSLTPKALLVVKPIQHFQSPQTMDWSLTVRRYLRAPLLMSNMSDRAWAGSTKIYIVSALCQQPVLEWTDGGFLSPRMNGLFEGARPIHVV